MRLREKVKKLFESEKITYLSLRILLSNADKELEDKDKELNELRNYQLHAQDDLVAKDKVIEDALAIGKHFEIDRETLVNKIKALIEDVDKRHHTYWADDQKGKSMAYGYCAEELQSLISEDLTSEDIEK